MLHFTAPRKPENTATAPAEAGLSGALAARAAD